MASSRRPHSPRSGRIKANSVGPGNELTIVRQTSGRYRIYNTGEIDFDVTPTGQPAIVLGPRTSADVAVTGDIVISRASSGAVRGIYELIDPLASIRGGKIKGDASMGLTIVQNMGTETLYRILNSGKQHSFDVQVNGATIATLEKRMSIDVASGASISVHRGDASQVSGIYDYLDKQNEIHAGRFSITLNETETHKIIDLTGGTKRVFYRIFNSGEDAFIVKRGTTVIAPRLRRDQSIDFDIEAVGDKIITVEPFSGMNKLIEGIYEYFGQE